MRVAEYSGEQLESAAFHFNSAHFAAVPFAAAHLNGAVHSTCAHFVAVLFLFFRVTQSRAAERSAVAVGSSHLTSFQSLSAGALDFVGVDFTRGLPLLTARVDFVDRQPGMLTRLRLLAR